MAVWILYESLVKSSVECSLKTQEKQIQHLKIARGLLHMDKIIWQLMRRWNALWSKILIKYYLYSERPRNPGQKYDGPQWDIYALHKAYNGVA